MEISCVRSSLLFGKSLCLLLFLGINGSSVGGAYVGDRVCLYPGMPLDDDWVVVLLTVFANQCLEDSMGDG